MRKELLAGAIAGELTPQDPDDEPASDLRRRLGLSNSAVETGRGVMEPRKRNRPTQKAEPRPDLTTVLRNAGGSLSMQELFGQAGYDRDLPEHIELFYLALRPSIDVTIRVTNNTKENAELGIIDAA